MKSQIAQKKEVVVQKVMTPGQMKDVISAVIQGIPVNLPQGSKKRLLNELKKVYALIVANPYADMVLEWEQFYLKHFQKAYDFSQLLISDCPGENMRLLIITDLLLEQLYAKCKELFSCWRWTDEDLDKNVVWNERDAKGGAYAIWVKNEVEADEQLKNISANDIKVLGTTTEALAERLLHELKFFDESGNHLDIKNWTLCAGSRCAGGFVPNVYWSDGKLNVDRCRPVLADGGLRSRQVVS